MPKRAGYPRWLQFLGDAVLGLVLFGLTTGIIGIDMGARAEPRLGHDAASFVAAGPADIAQGVASGLPAQSDNGQAVQLIGQPLTIAPVEPGATSATAILAVVFSLLFSLNLGFWRHVRRTYVAHG